MLTEIQACTDPNDTLRVFDKHFIGRMREVCGQTDQSTEQASARTRV